MRNAAEGSLQWAIPEELRAHADGDEEETDLDGSMKGEFDNWTIVRHLTQFFR